MISISLMVGGKEQTYTARGVTLRTSLMAYDLYREYDLCAGNYTPDLLDRCAAFVCACFGGAFTQDQLMDGYMGSAFRLFPNMLNAVVGYSNETIANFPEPAATTTEIPETI